MSHKVRRTDHSKLVKKPSFHGHSFRIGEMYGNVYASIISPLSSHRNGVFPHDFSVYIYHYFDFLGSGTGNILIRDYDHRRNWDNDEVKIIWADSWNCG